MIVRGFRHVLACVAACLAGCSSTDEQGRTGVDVFPLYRDVESATSGERSVLWPLSNAEWDEADASSRSWIFPFYVHWKSGRHDEGTFVPILPLYMHRRTLESEETQYVPFYGHRDEGGVEHVNVLLFLFEWARDQHSGALESSSVFPLYQWVRGGAGQRFSLLRAVEMFPTGPVVSLVDVDTRVPSFRGEADAPGLTIDVLHAVGKLVQLFHWGDAGSYTETRVLTVFASEPLSLFRRRVPHEGAPGAIERSTVLFPFYWDVDDGVEETWRLWPFYARSSRGDEASSWSVVSGAFGFGRDGKTETLRLFWFPIDISDADAPSTE